MTRTKTYTDCVYYYTGGRVEGSWHRAAEGTRSEILRQGYPAVDGYTKVGHPEGYPRISLRKEVNRVCGVEVWPETDCAYCGNPSCMSDYGHCQ